MSDPEDIPVNKWSTRISSVALIMLSLLVGFSHFPGQAAGAVNPNKPVVGVWSNSCFSSNMTISSCPSGYLDPGNTISVQVNVTNAPVRTVTGFEFYLYYDPTYLNATGYTTTGTVFPSGTPPVVVSGFLPLGTVHLAVVSLTGPNILDNGALININFKILAVGVSPLTLAAGLAQNDGAQSFTMLVSSQSLPLVPNTSDGYFTNVVGKLGPVASFTFSPSIPREQQRVTFYANASYDPDAARSSNNNGIVLYKWDFGGVSSQSTTTGSPIFSFVLGSSFGNFSVRLTVVDSDNNFQGMKTKVFTVSQTPLHDLLVRGISDFAARPGDKLTVKGIVYNNGTFIENFTLAVSYGPPTTVIGTINSQTINNGESTNFSFLLDTSGLAPGFYTIKANVTVLPSSTNPKGVDEIPANNVATGLLSIQGESSSLSSPLLLIAGGAVAAVVVLAVVATLLRRRRRDSDST